MEVDIFVISLHSAILDGGLCKTPEKAENSMSDPGTPCDKSMNFSWAKIAQK